MTKAFNRLLAAVCGSVLCIGSLPSTAVAQTAPAAAARIKDVLALEPADTPYGKYRVVFTTTAPLPVPTDSSGGVTFFLDDQLVRMPQHPVSQTLHFGYIDRAPTAEATLKMIPLGDSDIRPTPSDEHRVDGPTLLKHARPQSGEYEAPHIRRSREVLDVSSAALDASAVVRARYLRRDRTNGPNSFYRLSFEIDELLSGTSSHRPGETVTFKTSSPPDDFELSATYLLFLPAEADSQNETNLPPTVRIWWPDHDEVLDFVRERLSIGDLSQANDVVQKDAVALLSQALSSPASEVRRSAAIELSGNPELRAKLSDRTLRTVKERLAKEPSDPVRESVKQLLKVSSRN